MCTALGSEQGSHNPALVALIAVSEIPDTRALPGRGFNVVGVVF